MAENKKHFWLLAKIWRDVLQIGELKRKRSSMRKMIYYNKSEKLVDNGMNCGRGRLEWLLVRRL